eukprot:g7166.t1
MLFAVPVQKRNLKQQTTVSTGSNEGCLNPGEQCTDRSQCCICPDDIAPLCLDQSCFCFTLAQLRFIFPNPTPPPPSSTPPPSQDPSSTRPRVIEGDSTFGDGTSGRNSVVRRGRK